MNLDCIRIAASAGLLIVASATADAVAIRNSSVTVDCKTRALPSQAAVANMLGEHNSGQAYAIRSRMMVEVSQACHREGTTSVRLVVEPAQASATRLARE